MSSKFFQNVIQFGTSLAMGVVLAVPAPFAGSPVLTQRVTAQPINLSQAPEIQISLVEVPAPDNSARINNQVMNLDRTLRAFTMVGAASAGEPPFQLLIEDLRSGRVQRVEGLPLGFRPLSNLVWLENDVLSVERWSNPRFGYRYEINVQTGTLERAIAISN